MDLVKFTLALCAAALIIAHFVGGKGEHEVHSDPGVPAVAGLVYRLADLDSISVLAPVGWDSRWLTLSPGPDPTEVPEPVVVLAAGPVADAPEPTPEALREPERYQPATDVEAAICAYGWDCSVALATFRCESRLRPDAVGAGSYGIAQIQASVWARYFDGFWEHWMNVSDNLGYAWAIYAGFTDSNGREHGGARWAAWSCAR